tara:strand:+ start:29 stop:163 length:135 start_codon:yes stop_codon:yes gene_type:complete
MVVVQVADIQDRMATQVDLQVEIGDIMEILFQHHNLRQTQEFLT